MLKALEEMQDVMQFPLNKIVYVMTDFTENNFNFWRDHPALKVWNCSHIVVSVTFFT
jgi:hypothetical protein